MLFLLFCFAILIYIFIDIFLGQTNVFLHTLILLPVGVVLYFRYGVGKSIYIIAYVISLAVLQMLIDFDDSSTYPFGGTSITMWVFYILIYTSFYTLFDFVKRNGFILPLTLVVFFATLVGSEIIEYYQNIKYILFVPSTVLIVICHYSMFKIMEPSRET
jgi:hypothetical protein